MLVVLRLEHRVGRDKRMTTHCALASRALGADRMVYSGDRDKKMEENVESVVERWGGEFEVKHTESWKNYLKNFDGSKVYLSMYGLPIQDKMEEVRGYEGDTCVVVGGEKIPGDIYNYIDIQVAVTNQPHSEVAALAVFLDRFYCSGHGEEGFQDASINVIPNKKDKEIEER